MPLHISSTSAHRQEAKIVLYSLWYRHIEWYYVYLHLFLIRLITG